jgi:hypothetical protein
MWVGGLGACPIAGKAAGSPNSTAVNERTAIAIAKLVRFRIVYAPIGSMIIFLTIILPYMAKSKQ